jgi:hypothetical protein
MYVASKTEVDHFFLEAKNPREMKLQDFTLGGGPQGSESTSLY